MKQHIGLVSLDSSLIEWLCEQLRTQAPYTPSAKELLEAFYDLDNGHIHSLMLEREDQERNRDIQDRIYCGSLVIDRKNRKVIRDGIELSLTPKEFDILYFLACHRGEVFTKEQIYQAVWENDYLFDDSNIMAFIRKLRKKIEPDPDAPNYILTIWGIGYKFNDQI